MDLNSSLESQTPKFNSIDDECAHWKKLAHELANKFADTKQEYTEFMENSKELESELETTLEQREKTIRDLKGNLNQIQNDNESLRVNCLTEFHVNFVKLQVFVAFVFSEKIKRSRKRLSSVGKEF